MDGLSIRAPAACDRMAVPMHPAIPHLIELQRVDRQTALLRSELESFPKRLREADTKRTGARASPFRIRFAEAFGEGFQFGAKEGRLAVNPLQLNQMGNRRMHGNRHSITGRRSPYGETVHWQVGR